MAELPLRVALIGCGGISRAHLEAWAAEPRAKVVYCVDVDERRAREGAERVGARWHTDYRAVLDEVDAVDICTPPHLHAEMSIAAAQAGKHILCEKVMARTLEEAEAMIRAAEEAKVVLMIAFLLRYRPEFQQFHDLCSSGQIGRLLQAYCQTSMYLSTIAPWRRNREQFPMGVFLSHGCHYVDQLQWHVGEITHAACFSHAMTFGDVIPGGEDTTVAIFRHANGAVSAYVESWAIRYPLTPLRIDVYGSEGSARLDYHHDGRRTVEVWDAQGRRTLLEYRPQGPKEMEGQIRHFVDCVLIGRTPLTDGRVGLQVMRIILAACAGEREGRLKPVAEV